MNLFETLTYDEYDTPLDTIDDVARFILNPDNFGLVFQVLRTEIAASASQERQLGKGHLWPLMTVGILRGMPEARALFTSPVAYHQIRIACQILDRAVAIMRGAA